MAKLYISESQMKVSIFRAYTCRNVLMELSKPNVSFGQAFLQWQLSCMRRNAA